jgi:hypothetical protein
MCKGWPKGGFGIVELITELYLRLWISEPRWPMQHNHPARKNEKDVTHVCKALTGASKLWCRQEEILSVAHPGTMLWSLLTHAHFYCIDPLIRSPFALILAPASIRKESHLFNTSFTSPTITPSI